MCPLHWLSTCGAADLVNCMTHRRNPLAWIPCTPCDPNGKMPLWFCSEPLGWAASHGQLHTVMVLAKNGGDPRRYNWSGNNCWTDALREHHEHVLQWLDEWSRVEGKVLHPMPGS